MNKNKKTAGGFSAIVSFLAIAIALVAGALIYSKVFGDPSNFVDNDPTGEPMEGNLYGVIYKGGFIVPILVAINLIIIIFSIERLVTLLMANGKGNTDKFIASIKGHMEKKDYKAAIAQCDKQKGSVGNVTLAAVKKYKQLATDGSLDKEQKLAALSKEVEEATSLELPILEKNLTIIATLASVSTLIGLLGTVIGMIKAFSALGNSGGSTDSSALANGISEALVNTALGIGTSAVCIIGYNFFTSKIDELTYSIDEIGLSVNQNFASHHS